MAVAYNSVGTRSSATTGTTVTPALPAAPSAGDLLVALVSVKNNATISTTTAGWVKLAQTNSGASFTVAAFYAIYQTSGVNAPAFTWTGSANNQAQVARFTGNLNAYFINPAKSTAATGSTSTHTSNGLSSIAADSLAFLYDLCAANTAFNTPTNWSAAFDAGSNAARLSGKTRAGAAGNTSATGGAAAWVAQQLEILAPTNYNLPFPSQARNNALNIAGVWAKVEADKADAYYRFVGGPQPNDSRNVNPALEFNEPPNGPPGPATEAATIYSAWNPHPDPNAYEFFGGRQPFARKDVPAQIENVPADTVLFKDPFGVVELPDYPIVLPPKIAATAGSNFVPRSLAWLGTVVAAWAPLQATPVLARNLSPSIPGVSVDNPVPSSNALEQLAKGGQWPVGWDHPNVKGKLSPAIPGQSVDPPPVSSNALEQLNKGGEWPIGWAYPPTAGKLSPGIPGQSVDNPVPRSNAKAQLAAGGEWPTGYLLPIVKSKMSPGIPGQSVDRPPVKRSAPDVTAWIEPSRLPVTGRFVATLVPGGSVDPPPFSSRRVWLSPVIGSWEPGAQLSTARPAFPPPTPATVDNPPTNSTATLQSIAFTISADALQWNFYSVFRPNQIPGGGGVITTDYFTVSGPTVEMLFPDYGVSNPSGDVSFPYPMVRRTV